MHYTLLGIVPNVGILILIEEREACSGSSTVDSN
jgi:hypothetical protein